MLNLESAYAIRAVRVLAQANGGGALLSREIAGKTGISPTYLSKILEQLALAGILTSRRGRGGGFTLAKPPHKVKLSDILVATGGDRRMGECLLGRDKCDRRKPCSLHPLWKKTRTYFFRELNKMKLSALDQRKPPAKKRGL